MSTLLPVTQLGTHLTDPQTVEAISVHTGGSGLIIGSDRNGRPVRLAFFRPEATSVLAVCGLHLAELIGFRAIALGAQIAIKTARPIAWANFAQLAASPDTARIVRPDAQIAPLGTVNQPQLIIVDNDSAVTEGDQQPVGAWTTVLTVREQLSTWDTNALLRSDLVVMQTLSAPESKVACESLNLGHYEEALTRVPPDVVTLVTRTVVYWAKVSQTPVEQRLIGPIQRS